MSQQVVSILVSAGGILLAASVVASVRGAFKVASAIRGNTAAIVQLTADLAEYVHQTNTEVTIIKKDVQDLKDWRLRTESANQAAALGHVERNTS
jgi:hypothetical protein